MKQLIETIKGYYRPYKLLSSIFFIGVLLDIGVEGLVAICFKFLVDTVIVGGQGQVMVLLIILMLSSTAIANGGYVYRSYLYAKVAVSITKGLRNKMYNRLQELSLAELQNKKPGEILSHFANDLSGVKNLVQMGIPAGVYAFLGILINLTIIFVLEWQLAIVAVLGLLLCGVIPYYLSAKALRLNDEVKAMEGDLLYEVESAINAAKVVKSYNLELSMRKKFSNQTDHLFLKGRRAFFFNDLMEMIPNIFIEVIGVFVICIGAWLAYKGTITPGTLVAFNTLFLGLSKSLADLTGVFPMMMESATAMNRLNSFLGKPDLKCDGIKKENGIPLEGFKDAIEFSKVSFAYQDSEWILKDVQFSIPKGQRVAFVGGSGSGKTSIVNLLMGFYQPQKGSIKVDDIDFQLLEPNSLKKQIGIVLQENFLFHWSIRENLKVVNPQTSDEVMIKAAQLAEIHEAIMKLPMGYDTVIGEGFGQLSGGQRQRLAIARALIANPQILILDEATSALDGRTEKQINETLLKLGSGNPLDLKASQKNGLTLISITHRLENIKNYHRIYVLDEGQIVEEGDHESLLKTNGRYAELYGKQSGFVVDEDLMQAKIEGQRLNKIHLFSQLSPEMCEDLSKRFVSEYYPSKATIVHQGDEGDSFYVIVRGKVEVSVLGSNGQEHEIAVLEDGDYFGEIALLKEVLRTATIKTKTPCMVLSLERSAFNSVIAETPEIKLELEQVMEQRLLEIRQKSEN